jgi:hypothetical protein
MAIDKVTSASITDSSVTDAKLSFNSNQFRNIIINGDMSVAQRSTSETGQTSSGYICVDRFNHGINSQGTWTISQDTTVPTGQGFAKSMKMDCTTADASPAADDYIWFEQKIEGQNLQYLKKGTSSAESVTVSFWVYATKTGTNVLEFLDKDNTRHICQTYTIDTTNTWEKKTITFAGDTSGAFNNDNGESASLLFWIGAGSNYTSGALDTTWGSFSGRAAHRAGGQVNHADSTSNNFYLTGIQMEAGTSASDFEFLPVDVNLQRCQRYYYKKISANAYGPLAQGMQIGASHQMVQGYHPVTMRSAPSLTQSGWSYEAGTGSGTWAIGSSRTNIDAWGVEKTGVSNSEGSAIIIYAENNAAAYFTADSEL